MSAGRLAWSLFALFVLTAAVGVALVAVAPSEAFDDEGDPFVLSLSFAIVMVAFGLVGALVASRVPANPVGWLFLALAVIEGGYELADGYTRYSLTVSELPGTPYAAWFANWSSPVSPALIGLAFLLFPDGRLLSRRWRPVAWLCVVAIVPVVAPYALMPGPIAEHPSLTNPLGVPGAGFLRDVADGPFIGVILLSAAVASIVRFRRSRGVERQQLKWFVFAAALIPAFLVAGTILSVAFGDDSTGGEAVVGVVFAVILAGLPISAGIAMLRYRLYDIDLVINRTLVYGTLTATLVATYLGSVIVIRLFLDPVTGDSELAVAASTLAVAALFRPLRARIQSIVDQRFYRARYDAARTLEAFAGRLRDEVDLAALGSDLRSVADQTLRPAHVSLWLREASR